jgi:hypothetical protein
MPIFDSSAQIYCFGLGLESRIEQFSEFARLSKLIDLMNNYLERDARRKLRILPIYLSAMKEKIIK